MGLSSGAVLASRSEYGSNALELHKVSKIHILFRQLNNPLLLILIATVGISYGFGDRIDATIIALIMLVSVGLGFLNESSSEQAVDDLMKRVSLSAVVIRGGEKMDVPVGDVVVGDTVFLRQGSIVPADLTLDESIELTANEAALTGEALPVYKPIGSTVLMGSNIVSGTGLGTITAVGHMTEYGKLSKKATEARPKTDFQKGLAALSLLMTRVIIVMAVLVCFLNIAFGKAPLQAVLFALSIAIGLTPALLPVITTICMAKGAKRMACRGVVVKRLVAIEDLGNMQVLCTDKTGTLTEGKIQMLESINMRGEHDEYVLKTALLCNTASIYHRIVGNPIDVAIWEKAREQHVEAPIAKKLDEEEFSYEHRFQFCVVERDGERLLLAKGAPDKMIEVCSSYRNAGGHMVPLANHRKAFKAELDALNAQGLRLVAVGQRAVELKKQYCFDDAEGMELLGYLTFLDTPKPSAMQAIKHLQRLGVVVKIVTGDNEIVTQRVAQDIGFEITGILTGPALEHMQPEERERATLQANVFARVTPEQKLQVITDLQHAGQVVGYMGDGINDATALHAADVGLSVNTAVDVAKDTASIVLLHKGLDVIATGVQEGRRIFANTIKYILMGTSSNFGNMFSVAGASFILPFLPLTPSQILLNNLLYDASQLGLPSDNVDHEQVQVPHRWDIRLIYRYMLFFGPISSVFDYLSFGLLYLAFHTATNYPARFQTGWFLESIVTQVFVVFVIRTSRSPFWKSTPASGLIVLCLSVVLVAVTIPYIPIAGSLLGFTPPPLWLLGALTGLVAVYLMIVEIVKSRFLTRISS